MSFVYRYVDKKDFTIKYVGLVNGDDYSNLRARINGHRSDEWIKKSTYDIDFIVLNTKNDAETLEGHLIAKYKTYDYYNVAKCKWGLSSFISEESFQWLRYNPKVKTIEKCNKVIKSDLDIDFSGSISEQFSSQIDLLRNCTNNDIQAIETLNHYVIPIKYIFSCINKQLNNKLDDLMCLTSKDYCLFKIKDLEKKNKQYQTVIEQQKQVISNMVADKEMLSHSNPKKDNPTAIMDKNEVLGLLDNNELIFFYFSYYDSNGNIIQKHIITKNRITICKNNGNTKILDRQNYSLVFNNIQMQEIETGINLGLLQCNNIQLAINTVLNYYRSQLDEYNHWKQELSVANLIDTIAKINTYKTKAVIYLDNQKRNKIYHNEYEVILHNDGTYRILHNIKIGEKDNEYYTSDIYKEGVISDDLLYLQLFISKFLYVIYCVDCPDSHITHPENMDDKINYLENRILHFMNLLEEKVA